MNGKKPSAELARVLAEKKARAKELGRGARSILDGLGRAPDAPEREDRPLPNPGAARTAALRALKGLAGEA